jgi:anti-anti-sigma factor
MSFSATLEETGSDARIFLQGELDASSAAQFKDIIEQAAEKNPKRLVLFMNELDFMASAGLRILIFAKQKMGQDVDIYVIGSKGPVLNTLEMSGFHRSVYVQDTFTE